MSDAVFNRKLKTFKSRMRSTILIESQEYIQNPMYPDDDSKKIPSGNTVETPFKIQMVSSSKSAEGYSEGSTGFMPDTYKWVLSLDSIPEGSYFYFHGDTYITGRSETLTYRDQIYGYRSPVDVRSS